MFGQAPATPFGAPATPFGSPAPAPFGQQPTSSPFGQAPAAPSAFGQPAAAPTAFGATSTFGQPAAAPAAFGQPAAAPSAFGAPAPSAFGQPAAAPSAFGQPAQQTTSVFGQPAAAPSGGLFGAPAPAPSAFGAPAPSAFGASKPLFGGGAPAPAPTGLFGAPAPAPSTGLFGAPAPAPSTGLFGAPAPAPSGGLFGAPATPFGAPAPAPSAFGAPAQPSAFGSPAPAPFGAAPAAGGFGGQIQQAAGTASTPFTTTNKTDGSNTIVLQSITGMPQFEQKSFEELRLEDYAAGNKGTKGQAAGPAAPAAGGFGGFGAAPQPAPAFGQPAAAPAGGLFGAPAPAPAGGLFGAPAPAPSAFGQPAAAPAPLFGAAPAQAPAGGLFGAPAPAPAFGAPAPAFGAAPAPATGGLFGAPTAPAPATGGLFGVPAAPAPAGGLFGAPAPAPAGGLFGAPAPAPAGGLFGAPAPAASGGLFGAAATPAKPGGLFGAPAPAGGLFGAPAPAPAGGLFGAPAPAPAGGLFGAPAPAPTGGLFGAPAPAPTGGLFGAPAAAAPVAPAPSAEALLAQQLAAVENQKKQLELVQAWSGNPSSGSKVVPSSYYDKDVGDWNGGGGSYATSSSALLSLRPAPRSAAKIRPRGYTSTTKQSPVASLGRKNGSPILSPNRFVGSATKTLFIKPNSLTPKPKTRLMLTNGITNGNTPVASLENGRYGSPGVPTQEIANLKAAESPKAGTPSNGDKSPGLDFYKQVVGSPDSSEGSPNPVSPVTAAKHLVPKLTKRGYDVYPSMAELEAMSEAELATVIGFKVERPGFGSVAWDGAVDVREVDIDAEVVIESKNVSVYDEAETTGIKPERGSKLNRPAVITMYGIFPKDGAEASAEAKQKLSRKIEKTTQKMKAELLSFESESGVWKFRVGHFSRYGLDDSDDESDDEEVNTTPLLEMEEKELGGTSNLRAPMDEDESTVYTDASDMLDVSGEETVVHEIIREGEMAYAMMTEEVLQAPEEEAIIPYEASQEDEKLLFPDEAEDDINPTKDEPLKPTVCPPHQSFSTGICSRLAAKSGIINESPSNIDYGMRMRRSFRVGWRPDGSFVHLQPSSSGKRVLVQSKPIVHQAGPSPATLPLLETHQKHSKAVCGTADDAPLFTLPSSKVALCDVLDDYTQSSSFCQLSDSTKQTVSNAFSLLTSLYGEGGIDDTRRLEALSTWLKDIVSAATSKDISAAESVGDTYAAIFAALAGGDTALASSIALESGNYRMSLLLANSGTQSQSFYEQQLKLWNESGAQPLVASDLLRIFSLASGSAEVEKTMFNASPATYNIDWRRRFGMYLWSCPRNDAKVSDVVEKYNADVLAKLAPAATSVSGESMCVLYQMLNHYISTDTPLSKILAPISHTPFRHDFSSSFHIGAMLSAVSRTNMSLHTEGLVVDAIASQLIAEGSWEWAVYVTLCLLDRGNASESTMEARRIRAKSIVSRFYNPSSDSSAEDRREFLLSIGVPPAWFFESTAYRAQNNGDLFGLVENLKKVSLKDCLIAVESFLIPHMILEGKEACGKLRAFLEALSSIASEDYRSYWDKPFGCGSIHQFLILTENVDQLSRMPMEEIAMHSDEIDGLLQATTDLESTLTSRTADQSHLLAKIPHQIVLAPTDIVQAEVVAQLYLLRMQLVAIKNGHPLKGLTTQPSTQHALASGFFAESILRELAST